jgi:hypothetical protein
VAAAACDVPAVAAGSAEDGGASDASGLGAWEDSPVPPNTAWPGVPPAFASTGSARSRRSISRQPATPISAAASVTPAKATA